MITTIKTKINTSIPTNAGNSILLEDRENIQVLKKQEWDNSAIESLLKTGNSNNFKDFLISFIIFNFFGILMGFLIGLVRFHVMSVITETTTDGTLGRDNLWLLFMTTISVDTAYGAELLAFVNVLFNRVTNCPRDKRFFFLSSNFFLSRWIRNIVSYGPANDSLVKFIRRYGDTLTLAFYCCIFLRIFFLLESMPAALFGLACVIFSITIHRGIIRATFKWLKYSNKS